MIGLKMKKNLLIYHSLLPLDDDKKIPTHGTARRW